MKKKILIIDADHLILYGLGKALRSELVEVSTASSAAMAEEELAQCAFDLCLIDLHLPDADGLELMKTIRLTCPRTRLIVMTAGYMNDEDLSARIREAAANGACRFLPKPFELGELKRSILGVLAEGDDPDQGGRAAGAMSRLTRRHSRHAYSHAMAISLAGEGRDGGDGEAVSVDISEGGVGLRTSCQLRASQVICMQSGQSAKTGVVVWSRRLADSSCRAGVRFA